MNDPSRWNRRRLLGTAVGLAPGALLAAGTAWPEGALARAACSLTATQSEGPFYPHRFGRPGNDLFVDGGEDGAPDGDPILVSGVVLDDQCRPVPGAVVEIWQADSKGRYRTGGGPSPELDARFAYWGRAVCGSDGSYHFRTIRPASYGSGGFRRTPHIHFKVKRRGREVLTTQMYFPAEPMNANDFLFRHVPADRRHTVLAVQEGSPRDGGAVPFRFDLAFGG